MPQLHRNSRHGKMQHSNGGATLVVRRAGLDDAAALCELVRAALHTRTPALADARAFLGRSDAGAFIATRAGEDAGCISFIHDHDVVRVFNPSESQDETLAALVRAVEKAAAAECASALFAQAVRGDQLERVLLSLGYSVEYEEEDVFGGTVVTFVDLIKSL